MILKNTSGQGVYLFASNRTTGAGLAGDQANITGAISKDGASENAFATANPTNIGGGLYWQPLSQAETNCNVFGMRWASATTDILIEPLVGFTDQGRIDATITSRAPSSTALSNATWTDAKAVFIDAAISSRMATFTYTAPSTPPTVVEIRTEMDANSTKLANLDAAVSTRSTYAGGDTGGTTTLLGRLTSGRATNLDNLDAQVSTRSAAGDAMTLTSGERTAIANEVEAQIINEADAEHVLTAITDKIASVNPDLGGLTLGAIASAVRTNLATELGRIDVTISTRASQTSLNTVVSKTNALPGDPVSAIDMDAAFGTVNATLGTISGYIDTEIAAIITALGTVQAKTNQLTFTTPNVVDASGTGGGGSGLTADDVWAHTPRSLTDKADFTLGATGLDSIPVAFTALPTTFRDWLIWLIYRHEDTEKVKVSDTASVIRVRGTDGDVVTEQDVTSGPTQITIGNVRTPG